MIGVLRQVAHLFLDPLVCRTLGHRWHVWIAAQPYLVCERCGRVQGAQ